MQTATQRLSIALLGLALLALTACASPYTPGPNRPFEPIDEFVMVGEIELENVQPAGEGVNIGGGVIANYREWTDVAITIARRELESRQDTEGAGPKKTLRLAVTAAECTTGWVTLATNIEMTVETGDGYRNTYTGINSSAMMANRPRQIDGAMTRAVREMLLDPKITAYLSSTGS